MCHTRLAANTGRKKVVKNRHLCTIAQVRRAISSQLRHVSTIGKKNLLSSNTSSTCSYNMVNFGPLVAEIRLLVWGTPANFSGFCVLASLLQRRRSTEVNQTLHYVWLSPGLVHYIELLFLSLTVEALQGKTCQNTYTLSGSLASWWNFATWKNHFLSIYAPSHKFLGLCLRN